ncbi:MAG: hypothetical protein GY816_14520, partial [Cytophagales bacterium]|nr:hypothetical protein [Cytophagales bacterium]
NNNQIPSTSHGYNGQVNAGYAPAPKTVNFADERGDGNFCGNQNGQFYPNPNQNPPFPLQYEEQGFQENFVLDDEGGDLHRIENNGNQYQNQNNGQNRNSGQNHNRNNQNNYRPPHQLCRRYGLHSECSFNTFEFDFKLACKMHCIPEGDKVDWFLMHLEGVIKEHACTWLADREQPTYTELIEELRPSFQ